MHCHTFVFFFFSSRRRHTRYIGDWSSDVCSSDLASRTLLYDINGGAWSDDLCAVMRVPRSALPEVGRASCRGKSVDLGGRRIIKKKKKRILVTGQMSYGQQTERREDA